MQILARIVRNLRTVIPCNNMQKHALFFVRKKHKKKECWVITGNPSFQWKLGFPQAAPNMASKANLRESRLLSSKLGFPEVVQSIP